MSTQTVKICDVLDCGQVATETLQHVTVANFNINQKRQDTSDGWHLWQEPSVDMCGKHEYEYRMAIPEMKLEQMRPIIEAQS